MRITMTTSNPVASNVSVASNPVASNVSVASNPVASNVSVASNEPATQRVAPSSSGSAFTPPGIPSRSVFLPPDPFVGWSLPDAITHERAAEILANLSARGFDRTGERYPANYRNNDRLVFDDPELAAELFARLRDRLPQVLVEDGDRWELCDLNPRFRACRYASGQSFRVHRDGPYAPGDDVRSFLTIQFYLDNDPARIGGHTRFYADPNGATSWASIAPCTGTAIVFDHRAWHDGESVTAGIKHVLRTDAIYRRLGAPRHRSAALADVSPRSLGAVESSTAEFKIVELGRHRGYAWHAISLRDGTIASAGRDGTVRWWPLAESHRDSSTDRGLRVDDLRAGSVTCLVEDEARRLWCGTRAGDIYASSLSELRGAARTPAGYAAAPAAGFTRVATGLAAVTHVAEGAALVAFTTSSGDIVAFDAMSTSELASPMATNDSDAISTSEIASPVATNDSQDDAYPPRWTARAHDGWAWGIAARGDGFLSCGHDGRVMRIDRAGRARVLAELDAPLRAIAAARDVVTRGNAEIAVVGDERGWLYWLGDDGRVLRSVRAHTAAVRSIAIGARVVSASEDGTVKQWRPGDSVGDVLLDARDFITSVVFGARGEVIAAGYDGVIRCIRSTSSQ
jgi:hypothetical protein